MLEENEVVIKVIETKKIPITKIRSSRIQARQTQVTKSLEIFAEQIRKIGLIQPIVVYSIDDGYELIVGQRRYYAHKDILKWNDILAMIIEKPEDDMMSTTISWLENEARLKMSKKDIMRHVVNLHAQKVTIPEIAKILTIKRTMVNACIGLPRVPEVVRQAVESGKISVEVAIKATDAKNFEKGITSEESGIDVLELAEAMEKHRLGPKETVNLVMYGQNNPNTNNEILLKDGIKNVLEEIKIDLSSSNMKRLEKYAKNNEYKTKSTAAAHLVLDGLDQSGD